MPKQSKEDDAQVGIDSKTVRRLLKETPRGELVTFLLTGARQNKAFRRKVLAWLIDTYADQLPRETVLTEIEGWVEDVFDQGRGDTPRIPALRDLAPLRTAVRRHPDVAVPAHLAVVNAVMDWLGSYGGGPDSLYQALVHHFEAAAAALPLVPDEGTRLTGLLSLEDAAIQATDLGFGLGFGLDRMALEALWSVRDHFPGRPFDYESIHERYVERHRRRRRVPDKPDPTRPG